MCDGSISMERLYHLNEGNTHLEQDGLIGVLHKQQRIDLVLPIVRII